MVCAELVNEINALQRKTKDRDLLLALGKLEARYRGYGGCPEVNPEKFNDFLYSIFDKKENELMALKGLINENKSMAPTMYGYITTPQEEDQDGGKSRRKSRRNRRKSRR